MKNFISSVIIVLFLSFGFIIPATSTAAGLSILGTTPTSGVIGDTITLTGSGFINISEVLWGTNKITPTPVPISQNTLKIIVPDGAKTEKITVKTTDGSVASSPLVTINTGAGWYYNYGLRVTDGSVTNTKYVFSTKEECETKRNSVLNSSTYDSKYYLLSECMNRDESVVIDGQGENTNGDYNLLAPIGTFKKAPNNIGDYFNLILKLAIGICAVLAVVMIIISGIQYMGDESIFAKTESKAGIKGAVFGLLIALGAYAILNTIDPRLLGGEGVKIDKITSELDSSSTSIFIKASNAQNTARCTPVTSGPCTVSNLSGTFGSQAESMSKICNIESSGNSNAMSGTDKGSDGTVFSMGLFQINLLANGSIITDTTGVPCKDLFVHTDGTAINGRDYITKDSSGNYKYNAKLKPGAEQAYNKCKNVLLDSTQNIKIAKRLANSTLSAWRYSDRAVCPSAFN